MGGSLLHRAKGCFVAILTGTGLCLLLLVLPFCFGILEPPAPATPESAVSASPESGRVSPSPEVSPEYRAIWISYLEWQQVDFTTAESFRTEAGKMLENCASLGANVVICHVRPFGDALYPSKLFPFSHLCTGIQGQDPGFDPLAILVEEAHRLGLQIEAWINPYRLQDGGTPEQLSDTNLAFLHPDWIRKTDGGLWLNPALTQAQDYIADGIRELCGSYEIDGIHFDDYFYPTTDPAFDEVEYTAYQASGGTLPLEDWRRQNVNNLVAKCYTAAHEFGKRFGIAPQGNLENNFDSQYSDVACWLRQPGFVDYLMPQFYWGQEYEKAGDNSLALTQLLNQWQTMPRDSQVQLYVGLGAYRIGDGDGSDLEGEWTAGNALARQVEALDRLGIHGVALYRYDSLFANSRWPELAGQEVCALQSLWLVQ